jgi:hypothetical protein
MSAFTHEKNIGRVSHQYDKRYNSNNPPGLPESIPQKDTAQVENNQVLSRKIMKTFRITPYLSCL